MYFVLCDRTPKPKSKEEPDREGKTGVQAEMAEGDERVNTESWFLKCHFALVPMWLRHMAWGRTLGSNSALPTHGVTGKVT